MGDLMHRLGHLMRRSGHLQNYDDQACCCNEPVCCDNLLTGDPPDTPPFLLATFVNGCGNCIEDMELMLERNNLSCGTDPDCETQSYGLQFSPMCCNNTIFILCLCCTGENHYKLVLDNVGSIAPDDCEPRGLPDDPQERFAASVSCDPFELVFTGFTIYNGMLGLACGCECESFDIHITIPP
jgi:hypothetical protein